MTLRNLCTKCLLPNVGYALAVWAGFYGGLTIVAWLTSAFAWFMVVCYATVLASPQSCLRSAERGLPCPGWVWSLADVSIGAALLATDAYWTAAGWILSAVLHYLIQWRGSVVRDLRLATEARGSAPRDGDRR